MVRHGVGRTLVLFDTHDLRNDLAGLLHNDRVADTDILVRDEILIVQRRIRDGRTGKAHGFDDRLRRQHTGAPDLHHNVDHLRRFLLRRCFR